MSRLEPGTLVRIAKFGLNGLVATGVHFSVLTVNLQVFHFPSAGLANLLAACFGITSSFIGNRYFVFRRTEQKVLHQAWRFAVLYGVLALVNGGVLALWTDWLHFDYRWGFLIATGVQFVLSYLGSKRMVFE